MERRKSGDVLTELVDLNGKTVADVGCGNGKLVRLMTRHGAKVTGLDPTPAQLDKARAADPEGDETYILEGAETLPFADASLDMVVFFNSLHHVPVDQQAGALVEAARTVKSGGLIYMAEPLAEGSNFEMMKPVHDETEVRAAAYRVIKGANAAALSEEKELVYVAAVCHTDYDSFRAGVMTINPGRKDAFEANDVEMRAGFEALGRKVDDGWEFDQPIRINLLRKKS